MIKRKKPRVLSNPMLLEQLLDIATHPVHDGDLISKEDATELGKNGLIHRVNGFNILSVNGLILLDNIGAIRR